MGTPSPLAYCNATVRLSIPPFGVFQAGGPMIASADGKDLCIGAMVPGQGVGPYYVDSGNGTAPGEYGSCYRAYDYFVWARWSSPSGSGSTILDPWRVVGPPDGTTDFSVDSTGDGFYYAGRTDSADGLILVTAKPPAGNVMIHFIILEMSPDLVATCWPDDESCVDGIPGINDDGTIFVIDRAGCYFNEANLDDYIGRHGFCSWMRAAPGSSGTGTGTGHPSRNCRYVVHNLCCPTSHPSGSGSVK